MRGRKGLAATSERVVRKAAGQDGFTLVEMLVVLMILAILSAAAYPRISGYMKLSRDQYRANHEYLVNKALMQYYALTGRYYMISDMTGRTMSDDQAKTMIKDLKAITGALIEDPTGTYVYEISGEEVDPDSDTWIIKSVKVKEIG